MLPVDLPLSNLMSEYTVRLDHVAIAVEDLEAGIDFYHKVLGFELTERRTTQGRWTGMDSAVMLAGKITFVLIQGKSPESQVSRYIEHYGPGVQHVAVRVRDLDQLVPKLEEAGMEFSTNIIRSNGLRQIFSKRDKNSGMMIELIERLDEAATFSDESVQDLFRQLEANDAY